MCAVTQYGQSVCAYRFLECVSPATSAVVGTARKPFIVVASMVIFHTQPSLLNVYGILLAFAGVGWYNYARHVERRSGGGQTQARFSRPAAPVAGLLIRLSVLLLGTRWFQQLLRAVSSPEMFFWG